VGGDLLNVRADDSANKEVIFILPYRNERGFERAQYKSLVKTVNGGFDEKMQSHSESKRRRGWFSQLKRFDHEPGRGKLALMLQCQRRGRSVHSLKRLAAMRAGKPRPYRFIAGAA